MLRRPVVTVLAAVLVAAGCTDQPRQTRPDASAVPTAATAPATTVAAVSTVAVIGDSITVGAEEEIRLALDDLGVEVVTVDAESGRRLTVDRGVEPGVAAARRVAALEPDLWVVALGTNDAFGADDADDIAGMVDALLAEIPPSAAVVWVDVYADEALLGTATVNEAIHERLDGRGEATVASWVEVVSGSDLLRDGVHPTAAGDVAFAGVVARGVAESLG